MYSTDTITDDWNNKCMAYDAPDYLSKARQAQVNNAFMITIMMFP